MLRPFMLPVPRRLISRAFMLAALASSAALPSCAEGSGTTRTSAGPTPTGRALHALFAEEWEHDLAEAPIWASSIGDRRFDAKWDDPSLAAQARREAHDRELLAKLTR